MKTQSSVRVAGFALVDVAVAATISVIFLGGMFVANSFCMNLLRNAKESAEGMLSNQERVEQLRSCSWSEVTDSSYWADTANNTSYWLGTVMNAPTQTGIQLGAPVEVIRVTENGFLQGATACYFEVTRNPAAATPISITAQNHPNSLVNAYMLRIDVTLSWTTLGGRSRSRSSTAIIARGGLTINESITIAPAVRW